MELVTPVEPVDQASPDAENGAAMYKRIGKRVVDWRFNHNKMSQVALARAAGVSVGCLQGLETGIRATRQDNLQKIARAIGMTLAELKRDDLTAIAPDPLLANLTDEDLEIARLFHDARTSTRVRVQRLLTQSLDAALQLAERFERLDPAFQRNLENLILDAEETLANERRETARKIERSKK